MDNDNISDLHSKALNQLFTNSNTNKSNSRKTILPLLLIIFGTAQLLFAIVIFFITSQLSGSYKEYGIKINESTTIFYLFIAIILCVIEFMYGFHLKRRKSITSMDKTKSIFFF